ncbi:MAG: hypothetical protein R3Y38_07570 [Rikenellaceae bacterium]
MLLICITVGLLVLVCLRIFLLACIGVRSMGDSRLNDALMECRNARLSDAYNEIAISIIVADLERESDLISLLSLDLNRYEVVLLLDFNDSALVGNILARYNMLKVDKVPTSELSCMSVRGVYRSRESVYSRLVIVDMNKGGNAQRFSCGANIARYEYVMALEKGCLLTPGAVCSVVRTLLEQNTQIKYCAVGGFRLGELPRNIFKIVDLSVKMLIVGAGFAKLSLWGENVSVVFDREYLVQAGGYGIDKHFDYELVKRIERMNERTKDDAKVMLMPKVMLRDRNASGLDIKKCLFSSGFVFGMLLVLMMFCLLSEYLSLVVLTVVFVYILSVCVAAMSVYACSGMLRPKNSLGVIVAVIFYPFFLIFRLIRLIRY